MSKHNKTIGFKIIALVFVASFFSLNFQSQNSDKKVLLFIVSEKNCLPCELKISKLFKMKKPQNAEIYMIILKDTNRSMEYNDYVANNKYPFGSRIYYFQNESKLLKLEKELKPLGLKYNLRNLSQSPSPIIIAYNSINWSYFSPNELTDFKDVLPNFSKYYEKNFFNNHVKN